MVFRVYFTDRLVTYFSTRFHHFSMETCSDGQSSCPTNSPIFPPRLAGSQSSLSVAATILPIKLRETDVRGIVSYIFFFTCGLIAAGAYFYSLHPQLSFQQDLPRIRGTLDEAIERGRRIQEAWREPPSEVEESEDKQPRESNSQP